MASGWLTGLWLALCTGEYAEDYSGPTMGGDSCGIHASGAGFEKVDKIEAWVPPKY